MLGIDWFLEYLLSAAVRWFKERCSSGWPIARGTVHASTSSGQTGEVVYTYIVDGERYTGEHRRRFWFTDSARAHAELFPPTTTVTVRFRAGQPAISIMRSQDQGKRGTQLDGL
jgi:hypothetical protein